MARTGCGSHGSIPAAAPPAYRARLPGWPRWHRARRPAAPEAGDCRARFPRPSWLADRGPAATSSPLGLPPTVRHGQRQDLSLPRARICAPAGAPRAMRPGQETSEGEAPEPAVPRRPAATNSPSTRNAEPAGRRCALASQRHRRDCGQIGRQHDSGHVSDTSAAAGGHIAAGRGRACGWRVTDPARRALTRLKVSSRGARPSPQAGSPRSAVPSDGGLARRLAARRTGPGGDAASDLLRPLSGRAVSGMTGRAACRGGPPGPGRAVIANPAAREVGVWPMRPGLIGTPPAVPRAAIARHDRRPPQGRPRCRA